MAQKKSRPIKTTSKSAPSSNRKQSTKTTTNGARSAATAKAPASAKSGAKAASKAGAARAKSVKVPKATTKPAAKKPTVAASKATAAPKSAAAPVAAKAPVVKPAKKAAGKPAPAKAAVAAEIAARHAAKTAATPAARAMPASVHKPAAPKLTGPAAAHPVTHKQSVKPGVAVTSAVAADAGPKKPVNQRHGFKTGEAIVYPAHGVGRIIGIEEQEIAGMSLELFVIQFEKDKLTLRVPTAKLESVGMRKLAEEDIVKRAMDTLKGKARIKRTMWSRRAQEYEAKINSGDLVAIAEVVRDLYRSETQPEQSYSERQLYESALDRMAREIAVVDKLDERAAMQRITEVLSRSARGRRMAEDGAEETKAA